MQYTFFYITMAAAMTALIITACLKPIKASAMITGLVYLGYSLFFDVTFGDRLGLYYYVTPSLSTLFMMLAAVFIYYPLMVIYLATAPRDTASLIHYTAVWVAGMLLLEYASLRTGSLVFTGWVMFPWSFLTNILTYLWVDLLYGYLSRRMKTVFSAY